MGRFDSSCCASKKPWQFSFLFKFWYKIFPLSTCIEKVLFVMIFCPTLEHKNDLKSLLSSSGNKMLNKNKKFQLLRNSCVVEGVLWLVKIILFFYLIDFFSSKLLFLTKSSFKMSTASVPRLLSRDFPSSNFGGSGIS